MRIEFGYLEFMTTARKIAPHFLQALSVVGPLWICYFVWLCRQSAQIPFPKSFKTTARLASRGNSYFITSALLKCVY
jgi:hypothetical protein